MAEKLEEMQAELDVLKEQYHMLLKNTSIGFLNQFYLRTGITLISPRLRGTGINADSGVGGFLGAGQYFGRNHVVDLAFEYDIYPSVSLRYRYEFHNENPPITIGPVAGIKVRAVDSGPIDDSIDKPGLLRGTFGMLGVILGFPLGRVLFSVELIYLFPKQNFLFANFGAHFFLF